MDPPKPKGIDFSSKEIKEALDNNHPLMMMLDFSNRCNLNCIYCFSKANEHEKINNELTFDNYLNILKQAKNMGVKTVFIPGAGEPTIDRNFWKILPIIKKFGMTPIIFTNGSNLTEEQIEELYNNGATVGIKVNSFIPKHQNFLAGVERYTKKRDKTLKLLIKKGFNKTKPTRLWLDNLVCKQNYNEIKKIFFYCRENNIWPGINTLFHLGSGNKKNIKNKLDVSITEIKKLWEEISKLDKQKYGFEWLPLPPYIGWQCNLYFFTFRVDNKGNISKCLGSPIMGNILDKNKKVKKNILKFYWDHPDMKELTNVHKKMGCELEDYYGCPCRRYLKNKQKKDLFKLTIGNKNLWESNI